MIELAFVACLSIEPTRCENRAMQFIDMSMMACVMVAQPELASWQAEHPGWEIQRWTCRAVGSGHSV